MSSQESLLESQRSRLENFDRFLSDFTDTRRQVSPESALTLTTDKFDELLSHAKAILDLRSEVENSELDDEAKKATSKETAKFAAELVNLLEGECSLCCRIYQQHSVGNFKESEQAKRSLEFLLVVLDTFVDFSASSSRFCVALSGVSGFFAEFVCPAVDSLVGVESPELRRLLLSCLSLLYTMYNKDNLRVYSRLSKLNVVDSAKKHLEKGDTETRIRALILISVALDEAQNDLYESAKDAMQLLIVNLDKSLGASDRRSDGLHTTEMLICLSRLALVDSNKRTLVDLQVLPLLSRMFSGGKEDEISAALDILFALSFEPGNARPIAEHFWQQLVALYKDSSPRKSLGAVWGDSASLQGLFARLQKQIGPGALFSTASSSFSRLTSASPFGRASSAKPDKKKEKEEKKKDKKKGKEEKKEEEVKEEKKEEEKKAPKQSAAPPQATKEATATPEGDNKRQLRVMISYQHSNKEIVKQVKETLEAAGIKVWIDYEKMDEGDLMDLMAEGVESCDYFVMCMSPNYKESENCKREASYAARLSKKIVPLLMQQKYKPTGWLGFLLGSNLYYDVSGKYPFEKKIQEVLTVLG